MEISTHNPLIQPLLSLKKTRYVAGTYITTLCRWKLSCLRPQEFCVSHQGNVTRSPISNPCIRFEYLSNIKYVCRQSREALNQDRFVHSVLTCHQSNGSFASPSKSFVLIIPIRRQVPDVLCIRYNTCYTSVKLTSLSDRKYVSYCNCIAWAEVSAF